MFIKMSFFGNNMNIMVGTVLTTFSKYAHALGDTLEEEVPKMAHQIKYYKDNASVIYTDVSAFVIKHQHMLVFMLHMLLITDTIYRKFNLLSIRADIVNKQNALQNDRVAYMALCDVDKDNQKMKDELFLELGKRDLSRTLMTSSLQEMKGRCEDLILLGTEWTHFEKSVIDHQDGEAIQKMKNIEEIFVDGCYNDPEYLAYNGDGWTMDLLKDKAIQMGYPDVDRGSRVSLTYVIWVLEQLQRIEEIVKPTYPDGYETQEMDEEGDVNEMEVGEISDDNEMEVKEDSKHDEHSDNEKSDGKEGWDESYGSDDEWLPEGKESGSDWNESDSGVDSDAEDYANDLLATMILRARNSNRQSYFFNSRRNVALEKLIRANGLNYKYTNIQPTGYTMSGYTATV